MLSEQEVSRLLAEYRLPPAGQAYVRRVRASEPSREVTSSGARNTPWRYASHKMACTIQGESTLERNFVLLCEYDASVFELWDQPEKLSVTYTATNGRLHRTHYTADFLVLRKDEVVAYQVKPLARCELLAKQRPGRWCRTEDGIDDVAGAEAFRALGIQHKLVTENDINQVECENLALLLQARIWLPEPDPQRAAATLKIVANERVLTLRDLLRKTGCIDATHVLRLIDQKKLAALLDRQRLAEPDDSLVGMCRQTLAEVVDAKTQLLVSSTLAVSHSDAPTLRQLSSVVDRRSQLASGSTQSVSDRTLRRWRQRLKEAGGNPLALVPQSHKRGNRERRIAADDLALIGEAIKEVLLVPNPPKPIRGYSAYLKLFVERASITRDESVPSPRPVSLSTFLKELARIPATELALAQGGRRSSNAVAAPIAPRSRALTPLRAFERAHIDHYLVDQHVVVGIFGNQRKTKRLWLSVMVDQATQVVLAMSVSFRDPSRRACASVLRDCVMRHSRLPETVVVDNGSDFQSVYFEVLLARYGVTKHDRPPEDPRFGGQIEAVFHGIKEEMVLSLRGSTANDERGRAISRSHRGQEHACWDILTVYNAYHQYFFKHYNLKVRPGAYVSASHRFDGLLDVFACSGVPVRFDQTFVVASAVPLERRLRVDPCRGVRHLDRWFFHPDLTALPDGFKVDGLEEPWNDRCIYVSVKDRWVPCLSGYAQNGLDLSEARMLESIVFLENRDISSEVKMSQYLDLEHQIAANRVTEAIAEAEIKKKLRRRRAPVAPSPRLPAKSPRIVDGITPFATQEGDWDGYRKNR